MRLRALLIGLFVLAVAAVGGITLAVPRLGGLVEDRLGRETGLRWHVGSLSLDPAPGLVLADVTMEGDGLSGRIRRVRASLPWGLLLGGSGTVQARIEAASLTVPLSLPEGGRRTGDGPAVSAVRAVVRGDAAATTDGGRALALSAASVDLALDLAPGPATRDPAIRLELPDRGTTAEIEAAASGAARTLTLDAAPGGGPRIAATAAARLDGTTLRLDRIAGTIDRAPFSGSLSVEGVGTRRIPRLVADLRLDALALADERAEMRADPVAGITVPVRTDLVPDPSWFAGFEAEARVAVQRLALGPVRATAFALTARIRDGRLDASLDGASLYGGTARGRYVLEPEGRAGRHQIGLSLSGMRVGPLMQDVAGVSSLDGTGTARLDVQARGSDPKSLLRTASGQTEVSVTDGRIDGLDLARAAGLTNFGGGLATRLDRLGAHFSIGDGRATTDDLLVKTGLIEAQGTGALDLVERTIDLRLKPLKVTAGGRLNVPIQISGPWSGPSVSADLAGLAQDPAGTLQGLQNLGNSILGGGRDGGRDGGGRDDGGLGGGGLGGLGGLGGRDGGLGEGLGGLLDGLMPRQDRPSQDRPSQDRPLQDRPPRRRP